VSVAVILPLACSLVTSALALSPRGGLARGVLLFDRNDAADNHHTASNLSPLGRAIDRRIKLT